MATTSYIVEEGPGRGKGHTSHGNGKGKGHDKHGDDAMADGIFTIRLLGIDVDNPTSTNQVSAPTTLADGSTLTTEVREGSLSIVDGPGADVDGALRLETDSNNGRLRVNDVYDADQQFTLGELDELSFDYYIESSDRTDVIPVIRLFVDADGDLSTTTDRGELVFEYAYQGLAATTQDAWQTADLSGDDWTAWQRANGTNLDQVANMTELSDWADADGYTPVGGITFDEDSVVLGWSIALGSGNGTNVAYIDDLQIAGVTYDFALA